MGEPGRTERPSWQDLDPRFSARDSSLWASSSKGHSRFSFKVSQYRRHSDAPQETHDRLEPEPHAVPDSMQAQPLDTLDDQSRLASNGRVLELRSW